MFFGLSFEAITNESLIPSSLHEMNSGIIVTIGLILVKANFVSPIKL